MENSKEYKYYSFDSENSILYHEVTNDNFADKMSFVKSLSYFSTLIETLQPRAIIIKVHKKPDFFELELKNFMQKTLIPTIINAGIQRVAFYFADKDAIPEIEKHKTGHAIKTRYFSDLEAARHWVLN